MITEIIELLSIKDELEERGEIKLVDRLNIVLEQLEKEV